jgi:hypothetical protein
LVAAVVVAVVALANNLQGEEVAQAAFNVDTLIYLREQLTQLLLELEVVVVQVVFLVLLQDFL